MKIDRAVGPLALPHRLFGILKLPGADAMVWIGRDIGRKEGAERRFQLPVTFEKGIFRLLPGMTPSAVKI